MATIRLDTKNIQKNLEDFAKKSRYAVLMYCQTESQRFERYAKTHKKWKNITGHAVQRLKGFVEDNTTKIRIYISHGVEYGKWLELAHGKRYAILWETIKQNSASALRGLNRILEKRIW